jgi:hypothetical protein
MVNPAIAMGVKQLELPDPLAQYGKIAAIQQAQQQNLLAQQQLAQAQRAEQQQNALSAAYQAAYNPQTGDIDANRLRSTLASSGFGAQIPTVEKGLGELEVQRLTRQKLGGEIKKAEGDLIDAALKRSRGFLDTLDPMDPNAPAQYMAWHEANHRDPVLGPLLAARGVTADQSRARIEQAIAAGPAAFAQLVAQSKLGTDRFMELNKPVVTARTRGDTAEIALTEPITGKTTIAAGSTAKIPLTEYQTQQLQISRDQLVVSQGQLRNAQARLKFEQDNPTLTIKETDTGQLIGIDSRTGAVKPIVTPDGKPVMGQTKPLTESQGTSVAYGMRMAEADKLLTSLENKGLKDTGVIRGTVSGVAGAVPLIGESMSKGVDNVFNLLPSIMGGLSPEQQQTLQARINFITAVLRKESGAAISQSEFATAEKNYFPAPGDDKTVISQKQRARATAIKAMKVQAGPGAAEIDKRVAPADEWELVK